MIFLNKGVEKVLSPRCYYEPAGRTPDASWSGSMLPRSLTVRGDAGARHELPA